MRLWDELFQKGKPMTCGSFFAILCVFMSSQFLFQLITVLVEAFLNMFGYSLLAGMNAVAVSTDSFSMFLYVGIFGPITEEILFRGIIQRSLRPYGRNFAILCSAFVFGLYHGNLLQSVYAFAVGLVLGYVASEYSIVWAMVLHIFNNLIVADVLGRLTAPMPGNSGDILFSVLMLAFAFAALVILIVNRRRIRDYIRRDPVNPEHTRCFFSAPGIIVLMILMGISMLLTFFVMLRPL